jgi:ABC-2 type transport system permease protein
MMAPLFLLSALVGKPNGLLAILLSLFPFTAPTTMMMRLSAGYVPLWQILLSIFLLAVTGLLIIRAVAGLFRAQVLLSGQGLRISSLFGSKRPSGN